VSDTPDLADAVKERPLPDGDREIWVRWLRVPNFRASGPRSRHYTLEAVTGEVTFGDGRNAGLTPPIGKDNIVVRELRAGGGEAANRIAVPLAIKELKTSLPFIDKVFNLSGAVGGAEAWTLDQIVELGPQAIKNRRRAVSTEDYVSITLQTFSQIARAKCLATRAPADGGLVFKPGAVSVIVMPKGTERMPQPSKALLRRIEESLRRHALGAIASDIYALPPFYLPVAIAAKVHPAKPEDASLIERRIVQALDEFFHPLTGGEHGYGWPFGRSVYISEVFARIQRVPGVDHVVEATFVDQPALSRKDVGENVLVASGIHQIAIV
jgi:predicted phage baseplate assembly protein